MIKKSKYGFAYTTKVLEGHKPMKKRGRPMPANPLIFHGAEAGI
jgi:hypothetical protein